MGGTAEIVRADFVCVSSDLVEHLERFDTALQES